jgi:hypothetical protein
MDRGKEMLLLYFRNEDHVARDAVLQIIEEGKFV